MRSFFSMTFILLMLNHKIQCQYYQFYNNFYPNDYDTQGYDNSNSNTLNNNNNNDEMMMMIPKVENYHPPKGYQPVKGYEPPNYKPNINNHIIFQDKPKLINSITENNLYNSNDDNSGQDTISYQGKNANEYNHPLLNLNRLPQTRYPSFAPINRPANQAPFNWTNYQNSIVFAQAITTVITHRPNLPTLHNTASNHEIDGWRRTPVTTSRYTTSMRYAPTTTNFLTTTENIQTTTKFNTVYNNPISGGSITLGETKTTIRTTHMTTTLETTTTSTTTTLSTTTSTIKTTPIRTTKTSTIKSTTSRNTSRRKPKTTTQITTTAITTTTGTTIFTTSLIKSSPLTESTLTSETTRKKTTKHRTKTTNKKTKTTRVKTTTSQTPSRSKVTSTITPPIRKTNFTYSTTRKYGSKNMIVDDNCMKCLCFIESWCTDVGCVMDQGSLSCGWYQLKYEYWLDCGQPGGSWKECGNNKECAEQCVRQYMSRYGGLCSTGNSCADLARIHNGGPYGCSARHTEYYGNMIARCLKRLSPYENIDELYKQTFPDAA